MVLAVAAVVGVIGAFAAFVVVTVVFDAGLDRSILAVLFLAVVVAVVVYATRRIRDASLALPEGVQLTQEDAPGLYALMSDAASRLGVRAPPRVLVIPGADAWLSLSTGEPVVVLGAPLLWTTRTGELQRLLAPEVALMRFVNDSRIRGSFEVMSRVRSAKVADTTTPGVGAVFRRLVQGLDRRVHALGRACREAAERHVDTVGLTASAADLTEAEIADEAWGLFVHGWAAPAWDRELAPRHVMRGFADFTRALESADAIKRLSPRAQDDPSLGLIADAQGLDQQLSELLAEHLAGPQASPLEWADYLELVIGPSQREQGAALFAAIDRALGQPVPATIRALAGALDDGWGPAVGAQLVNGRDSIETDSAELVAPALIAHLAAIITTTVVDNDAGFRSLDWVAGPVLVTNQGEQLPVHQWAERLLSPDGAESACAELAQCGVLLDQPVWVGGSEGRQRGYPDAVLMVSQRWRLLHLVFTDDSLVLLHDRDLSHPVNGLKNLRGGNSYADAQKAVLRTPTAELASRFQLRAQIPFGDIVSARLKAKRSGWKWRCQLHSPSGHIKFSGWGSGLDLSNLLGSQIGDRLRASGPVNNDAADPNGRAILARWVGVYPGLFLLALTGLMALSLTGTAHPALVDSCTSERDKYGTIEYTCAATVNVDDGIEQTTLHPLQEVPPGTPIEVRVTSLPFGGPVIAQPYETKHALWPLLVIGAVMVGGGAPFVFVRWRRRRNAPGKHA